MLDGYKIREQALPHFITTTVNKRIGIFTIKSFRDCTTECLNYFKKIKAEFKTLDEY